MSTFNYAYECICTTRTILVNEKQLVVLVIIITRELFIWYYCRQLPSTRSTSCLVKVDTSPTIIRCRHTHIYESKPIRLVCNRCTLLQSTPLRRRCVCARCGIIHMCMFLQQWYVDDDVCVRVAASYTCVCCCSSDTSPPSFFGLLLHYFYLITIIILLSILLLLLDRFTNNNPRYPTPHRPCLYLPI